MDSEPFVRREEMNQFEKRMDSYNLSLKEDISAMTGKHIKTNSFNLICPT